jgi:deazaflavin-dependent oxidoreductase (nitroreductase family)
MSKTHLLVHRLSRGQVLNRVAGMPVLLLTTTGRRSGKPRTTPLTFFRDGASLVVIASNGGADRPPDWSLNLQQNPRAVVKIGTDELTVQARTASPEERERLWVGITATYSGYARYQHKTARQIPVLILIPDREPERRQGQPQY